MSLPYNLEDVLAFKYNANGGPSKIQYCLVFRPRHMVLMLQSKFVLFDDWNDHIPSRSLLRLHCLISSKLIYYLCNTGKSFIYLEGSLFTLVEI